MVAVNVAVCPGARVAVKMSKQAGVHVKVPLPCPATVMVRLAWSVAEVPP